MSRNTARSVTYIVSWPSSWARLPLNVTCSTAGTNFRLWPSFRIRSRPSPISRERPLHVNVPTKTTFRAFWLMLMNPPHPARSSPNRLTLTFPAASTCAIPRYA